MKHLDEVHEGYFTHLIEAWKISALSIVAAIVAFLHGIFPTFFPSTASDLLRKVLDRQTTRQGVSPGNRG